MHGLLALILLASSGCNAAIPPPAAAPRIVPVGERMEALFRTIEKDEKNEKKVGETFARAELLKQEAATTDSRASYYWAGIAGKYAQSQQNLGSLKLVKRVEKELVALFQQDPCQFSGGVASALSKVYAKAPRVLSVGSKEKAEKYGKVFEQCKRTTGLSPNTASPTSKAKTRKN